MPPRPNRRLIKLRETLRDFRWVSPGPGGGTYRARGGVDWSSCHKNTDVKMPFRLRGRPDLIVGGIYLAPSDIALLGLAGITISAPLSLAFVPASFVVTATSILPAGGLTGTSLASGLAGTSLATLLGGLIKPQFTNFTKPCPIRADTGAAF